MNDIITPFAYGDLPAPIAAELQAVTSRIKDRLIRQVTDIIETGRDLIEVKSKLDHGQFQSWLNLSFNMTVRTAQKYMQAAEWMADKSELSSHLTPNTIYLLSAPTTPEAAQRQVLGGLEAGKVVNHREVCETVREVKHQEREAKKNKGETRAERKQRKAHLEQLRRKHEDELQRIETAAMAPTGAARLPTPMSSPRPSCSSRSSKRRASKSRWKRRADRWGFAKTCTSKN